MLQHARFLKSASALTAIAGKPVALSSRRSGVSLVLPRRMSQMRRRASTPPVSQAFMAAVSLDEQNYDEKQHHSSSALVGPTATKPSPDWEQTIPHPGYNLTAIEHIEQTHHTPTKLHDRVALFAVKLMRTGFDILSGYRGPGGAMTERDWLNRCVFLETVAGVPGMVAGMARHFRSLRGMRRDYGWIHTLLEEAENERMHLMIFVQMRQPGWLFRLGVLGAQGVFFNAFFWTYLISPKSCHRFVGYLEEEAVKTYTGLLHDIQDGHLPAWKHQRPPKIARSYYNLTDDATIIDLVKCVRADEANHRDVNHSFADLKHNQVNPYALDITPYVAGSHPSHTQK